MKNKFMLNAENNSAIDQLLQQVETLDILSERVQEKIVLLCAYVLQVSDMEDSAKIESEINNFHKLLKALQIFTPVFIDSIRFSLIEGLVIRRNQIANKLVK